MFITTNTSANGQNHLTAKPFIKSNNVDIICTLGPSSCDVSILTQLIEAGMTIARFNMSHSDYNFHRQVSCNLRSAEKAAKRLVKKIFDLQGPKLRISATVKDREYALVEGEQISIVEGTLQTTEKVIYVDYEDLFNQLQIGTQVFFGDCNLVVEVCAKDSERKICTGKVVVKGTLRSRIGVYFDQYKKRSPITDKDKMDMVFAVEQGCDAICMSFVNDETDIIELKSMLHHRFNREIPIIAKVESKSGFYNLDKIINVSDAIMIARGDLGISFPLETLPFVQNMMINRAREKNAFIILATQLFYSMVNSPFPTRAEVSDTAHAITGGVDALMLSEETSIGKYPLNTVKCMSKIIDNSRLYRCGQLQI